MVFVAQVLIVIVLSFMVFSLLFMSWKLNYNINWYYAAAQPYLSEMGNRSMSIMRHADNSSASLERVMLQGDMLAADAVPNLVQSVANASSMVARARELAQHPTIKLSLDTA